MQKRLWKSGQRRKMRKYGQCTSRNPAIRALYKEQPLASTPKKIDWSKVKHGNYNSKPIIIDGQEFPSITMAAGHFGRSSASLLEATRRGRCRWCGHTIDYEGCLGIKGNDTTMRRPVIVDGTQYPTCGAAIKALGEGSTSGLCHALKHRKTTYLGHRIANAKERFEK